jgi:hypothetical protein
MTVGIVNNSAILTTALAATKSTDTDQASFGPASHERKRAVRKTIVGGLVAVGALVLTAAIGVAAVGLAAPAQANTWQDQDFYRLLTDPDQSHPMAIWNFPLVRSQGIAACQREDAGESPWRAMKDLQYPTGPYTFDDASSITSSAEVIYCPWHGSERSGPDWLNISAPVYPRPVYPPLAWYPPPGYYPPPQYYPPPVYSGSNAQAATDTRAARA